MSFDLNIVKEPKITASTGTASYWSMVQNPLIFKFQRKDLIIKSVTDSGGGITKLTFFDSPWWMTAGDYIWWGDTLNQNDGSYLITTVDKVNNWIEIGHVLSGHVLGWVNDTTNIQNYHVYMDIFEWLGSGLEGDRIAFAKFYDDQKGLITADLRDYLNTKVGITIPSVFGVATRQENADQDYSFNYRPGFIHTSIDPTLFTEANFNTRYWAIKASAQLGDEYGQNMRRYMTYPAIDPINTDALMDFNSMFDEPYFFDGYPFLLSCVYSEKQLTNYINRHIQWLDINDGNVSTEKVDQLPFTIAEHGIVVTPRSRTNFSATVEAFYLWLEESATSVSSGGGGGGGGADLDTGPGDTDVSTLEADIVEAGIIF